MLITPTRDLIPGPIWVSDQDLRELDTVIDSFWPRLEARREQEIDRLTAKHAEELGNDLSLGQREEYRKRLESSPWLPTRKGKRELTMYFERGQRVSTTSFSKLLNEPELEDRTPSSFVLSVDCGGLTIDVSVGDEIDLKVSPDTDADAAQVFGALKNWARRCAPRSPERIWKSLASYGLPILPMMAFVIATAAIALPGSSGTREYYRQKAESLMRTSHTEKDLLQVLLAATLEIAPPVQAKPKGLRWWWWILFSYLLSFFFAPRSAIGVGRGRRKLTRWRTFSRFILYTFPLFVVVNLLVPLVFRSMP